MVVQSILNQIGYQKIVPGIDSQTNIKIDEQEQLQTSANNVKVSSYNSQQVLSLINSLEEVDSFNYIQKLYLLVQNKIVARRASFLDNCNSLSNIPKKDRQVKGIFFNDAKNQITQESVEKAFGKDSILSFQNYYESEFSDLEYRSLQQNMAEVIESQKRKMQNQSQLISPEQQVQVENKSSLVAQSSISHSVKYNDLGYFALQSQLQDILQKQASQEAQAIFGERPLIDQSIRKPNSETIFYTQKQQSYPTSTNEGKVEEHKEQEPIDLQQQGKAKPHDEYKSFVDFLRNLAIEQENSADKCKEKKKQEVQQNSAQQCYGEQEIMDNRKSHSALGDYKANVNAQLTDIHIPYFKSHRERSKLQQQYKEMALQSTTNAPKEWATLNATSRNQESGSKSYGNTTLMQMVVQPFTSRAKSTPQNQNSNSSKKNIVVNDPNRNQSKQELNLENQPKQEAKDSCEAQQQNQEFTPPAKFQTTHQSQNPVQTLNYQQQQAQNESSSGSKDSQLSFKQQALQTQRHTKAQNTKFQKIDSSNNSQLGSNFFEFGTDKVKSQQATFDQNDIAKNMWQGPHHSSNSSKKSRRSHRKKFISRMRQIKSRQSKISSNLDSGCIQQISSNMQDTKAQTDKNRRELKLYQLQPQDKQLGSKKLKLITDNYSYTTQNSDASHLIQTAKNQVSSDHSNFKSNNTTDQSDIQDRNEQIGIQSKRLQDDDQNDRYAKDFDKLCKILNDTQVAEQDQLKTNLERDNCGRYDLSMISHFSYRSILQFIESSKDNAPQLSNTIRSFLLNQIHNSQDRNKQLVSEQGYASDSQANYKLNTTLDLRSKLLRGEFRDSMTPDKMLKNRQQHVGDQQTQSMYPQLAALQSGQKSCPLHQYKSWNSNFSSIDYTLDSHYHTDNEYETGLSFQKQKYVSPQYNNNRMLQSTKLQKLGQGSFIENTLVSTYQSFKSANEHFEDMNQKCNDNVQHENEQIETSYNQENFGERRMNDNQNISSQQLDKISPKVQMQLLSVQKEQVLQNQQIFLQQHQVLEQQPFESNKFTSKSQVEEQPQALKQYQDFLNQYRERQQEIEEQQRILNKQQESISHQIQQSLQFKINNMNQSKSTPLHASPFLQKIMNMENQDQDQAYNQNHRDTKLQTNKSASQNITKVNSSSQERVSRKNSSNSQKSNRELKLYKLNFNGNDSQLAYRDSGQLPNFTTHIEAKGKSQQQNQQEKDNYCQSTILDKSIKRTNTSNSSFQEQYLWDPQIQREQVRTINQTNALLDHIDVRLIVQSFKSIDDINQVNYCEDILLRLQSQAKSPYIINFLKLVLKMRSGEIQGAYKICQEIEYLPPLSSLGQQKAHWLYAQIYFQKSKYNKVIQCLERIGDLHKSDYDQSLDNDKASTQQSDPLLEEILTELLPAPPQKSDIQDMIQNTKSLLTYLKDGDRLQQSLNYTDAIFNYSQGLKLESILNIRIASQLYYNRSICYFQRQQFCESMVDCLKSIAIDPHYFEPYVRLVACFEQTLCYNEAYIVLSNMLSYCSDSLLVKNPDTLEYYKKKQQDFNNKVKQQRVMQPNCYLLLGLAQGSKQHQIKKRFKRLALDIHPDKCVSCQIPNCQLQICGQAPLSSSSIQTRMRLNLEILFKVVVESKNILLDNTARCQLDHELSNQNEDTWWSRVVQLNTQDVESQSENDSDFEYESFYNESAQSDIIDYYKQNQIMRSQDSLACNQLNNQQYFKNQPLSNKNSPQEQDQPAKGQLVNFNLNFDTLQLRSPQYNS